MMCQMCVLSDSTNDVTIDLISHFTNDVASYVIHRVASEMLSYVKSNEPNNVTSKGQRIWNWIR